MKQAYTTQQRDYFVSALEILSAAVAGTWRLEKGVSPEEEAQPAATSAVDAAAESGTETMATKVALAAWAKSSSLAPAAEQAPLPRSAAFFQALPWQRPLIQPDIALAPTEPAIARHPVASTPPQPHCLAYFASLPWQRPAPTAIAAMAQAGFAGTGSATPKHRCKEYFQALPWAGLPASSNAAPNAFGDRDSASFFAHLPWQGGGQATPTAFARTPIGNDLALICDRATHTALQAAAKAKPKPAPLAAQASSFFQAIPWQST